MVEVAAGTHGPDDVRAAWIVDLVRIDADLQAWLRASEDPPLEPRRESILRAVPNPTGDDPEGMLLRWRTIFGDDIALVHDVRNLVVHGVWVSDEELYTCLLIGDRVLRLLVDPGLSRQV